MPLPSTHKVVRLKRRPIGLPVPGTDLVTSIEQLPSKEWLNKESERVVVRNLFLSLDPAMRGFWMRDVRSYLPPVKIDAIMRGGTVAEVVSAPPSSGFARGDIVSTFFRVVRICKLQASVAQQNRKNVDKLDLPLSAHLGVLGGTGLTAYFGLLDVGKPKAGDVVLVSGAAGATGSTVCQIAKNVIGCKVIGICGGSAKTAWLKEESIVNETVDYKDDGGKAVSPKVFRERLNSALKRLGTRGVDIYFDNVGGFILDEAMRKLNMKARIVVCGAISTYNDDNVPGPKNYLNLIVSRARMEGFLLMDYASEYGKARRDMAGWIKEGKLKFKEDVRQGLENAPDALLSLFNGKTRES